MKLFDSVLDALAQRLSKRIQGIEQSQAYRDAGRKGTSFSVESMVSENLTDLMFLNFEMPISGGTARASWLDSVSDDFCRDTARDAVSQAFLTGDCITVPSWNGHSIDNVIVDSGKFAILGASGNRLSSVIYVVDEKQIKYGPRYTLLRLVELVPYTAEDGTRSYANRYRTFIAKDGTVTDMPLSAFPDWDETNEEEWFIPNVDRLLVARYRCFTANPNNPNAMKGCPVCFGASDPIREIHYLTEQMHNEFGLSEKAIIADKRLFQRQPVTGSNGEVIGHKLELPKGRERLFMDVKGGASGPNGSGLGITEWAPTIQLQPYLDALDFQYKRVEKCVGVNSGVISEPNDVNYMNVDNVRKSTIQTQSFINTARKVAESYLSELVYIWDVIANFYGITPVAEYEVQYRWSDDYINTFSDQQASILAGEAIGATDAVDYRQFVMGESPEVARRRVEEIKADRADSAQVFEPVRLEDFA